MTWYPDLGPLEAFGVEQPSSLRAVGWLDPEHSFATGAVSAGDFATLGRLLVAPWQPFGAAGAHRCGFCVHTGGPAVVRFADLAIAVGTANVFVPAGDVLYVAPSLVLHYIDAHGYRPPEEFLAAARACPPMGSGLYRRALLAAGGRALVRGAPVR